MELIVPLSKLRMFWLTLPLLVVGATLDVIYVPLPFAIAGVAILIAAGVVVFIMNYRALAAERGGRVEANELKDIILNLDDALVVYNQNFRIKFFNPAAEKLFRLTAASVVGQELQPKDAGRPDRRLLAQVLFPSLAPTLVPRTKAGDYPQVADLSFVDPTLELRVTTTPIVEEGGKLYGFMKIVRDRTRELMLLRAKTEFISVASHQLRTPINEVRWAVELLTQDKGLSEESHSIAERTLASATSLAALVDNLLDTARIEEGRFGYSFVPTNLVDLLGSFLGTVMPQVERAGLKLYFDRPDAPLPQAYVDSQKLSMVMANLMDNAVRYNVKNGTIIVKIGPATAGPFLEISMKDTGIGVPAEQVTKLFTKFFRGDNAAKAQAGGTGLGLYIARNVIQAHGGQMWMESELNRGSTVHFILPTDPTLVPSKEVTLEE